MPQRDDCRGAGEPTPSVPAVAHFVPMGEGYDRGMTALWCGMNVAKRTDTMKAISGLSVGVLLSFLAFACGGATGEPGTTGGTSSGGTGSGTASSGGTGSSGSASGGTTGGSSSGASSGATGGSSSGGVVAVCPQVQPSPGDGCSSEGLLCEWGSNPVPGCDPQATCTGGSWQFATMGMQCSVGSDPSCPATFADVPQGTSCTTNHATCDYPEGRCVCGYELPAINQTWQCQQPAPGCPMPRPRLGTACAQEGQSCDYGSCTSVGGNIEQCTAGVWVTSLVACGL
jgi:hypothetical protein